VLYQPQADLLPGHLHHLQFGLLVAGQVDELVRIPLLVLGGGEFVPGAAALGPGLQVRAMAAPERVGQLARTGIQDAQVVERSVQDFRSAPWLGQNPSGSSREPVYRRLKSSSARSFS